LKSEWRIFSIPATFSVASHSVIRVGDSIWSLGHVPVLKLPADRESKYQEFSLLQWQEGSCSLFVVVTQRRAPKHKTGLLSRHCKPLTEAYKDDVKSLQVKVLTVIFPFPFTDVTASGACSAAAGQGYGLAGTQLQQSCGTWAHREHWQCLRHNSGLPEWRLCYFRYFLQL
jgi:hypothetical protein